MVKTRSMMSLSGRASSLKEVNVEDRAAAAASQTKVKEMVIEQEDYKNVEITDEELLKARALYLELHEEEVKAMKEKRKFAYNAELYDAELKYRWISRKLTMKRKLEYEQERAKRDPSLGYIFRPAEGILVDYYLRNKCLGKQMKYCPILDVEVNVYNYHPQHLIENYQHTGENAWYFFTCGRPDEVQHGRDDHGSWISGGKNDILHQGKKVGVKEVLEYCEGDHDTKYKMIHYQLAPPSDSLNDGLWFVCKLYKDGQLCGCAEPTLIE